MKKAIFTTVVIFSVLTANAQKSDSKLKLHAANLGFGGFSFKKNNYEGGGATFFADVTTSIDKNLIAVSYLAGSDIGILGNSEYKFDEISLSYGREWKAANWLHFEGFAGIGRYHQQSDYFDEDIQNVPSESSVSFPLKVNTKFYFTKKFGMGFNTNYSINSVNNVFSTNLIFHYRFN